MRNGQNDVEVAVHRPGCQLLLVKYVAGENVVPSIAPVVAAASRRPGERQQVGANGLNLDALRRGSGMAPGDKLPVATCTQRTDRNQHPISTGTQ